MTPGAQESDILMITVLLKEQRLEPPKGRERDKVRSERVSDLKFPCPLEISVSKLFIGDLIYRYCIYRCVELWPQDLAQSLVLPPLLVRRLGGQANIAYLTAPIWNNLGSYNESPH